VTDQEVNVTEQGRQTSLRTWNRSIDTLQPRDARELGTRVSLHVNTVRSHLRVLAEAGLVSARREERTRPGRPRVLYEATAEPLDERALASYRLLAQIIASSLAGSARDPSARAEEAGRAWGAHLIRKPAPFTSISKEETIDEVVRLHEQFGFMTRSSLRTAKWTKKKNTSRSYGRNDSVCMRVRVSAPYTIAELLHLESTDPDTDIAVYINCPGRSVYAGLAIYDAMQFVKPAITTICVGIAMSMGALLLAGGARGKRMALPNAKILVRQLWGGFEGEASDIEFQARETIALKRRREELIAQHTGQPLEKVAEDMERDYFLSAENAVVYGIIDRVLTHRFA
jgi:ATP-dependent Clp protease protease subunit